MSPSKHEKSFFRTLLETGLKEIFRAAGVTNHAWVYDPSPQPRKIGKWSVKRIFVLAEGAGGDKPAPTKAPPAPTESPKEPPTISDKKEFGPNRETYFDARSNRFVEVVAREVLVRFRKELSDEEIEETIQSLEAQVLSKHKKLRLYHLKIPQSVSV